MTNDRAEALVQELQGIAFLYGQAVAAWQLGVWDASVKQMLEPKLQEAHDALVSRLRAEGR